jgi:integrase
MSIYKSPKSPFWHYDFQIEGDRFHGSTKCRTRREAEKAEAIERERARAQVKAQKRAEASLSIDDVADRFWLAHGQHSADPDAIKTNLARLIGYFGPGTSLTDIDDVAVAQLVAWRRGQRVKRRGKERPDAPFVASATVNRSTTKVLARLFGFAKGERAIFECEPNWERHWLPEPEERVRELQDHEGEKLDAAMRGDYAPYFDFVRASGMRQFEGLDLRWGEVNFGTKQIVRLGKGGRRVTFPITNNIREILFPLQGHHTDFVFTYVAVYGNKRRGLVRGQHYPLTRSGVKAAWQRMRKNAGVKDFRFHDFRHDFGTKLLRETGNVKLVQRALNHRDIKSTLRYAHVLDSDIAKGVEAVAQSRKGAERVAESRNLSRTRVRKVS